MSPSVHSTKNTEAKYQRASPDIDATVPVMERALYPEGVIRVREVVRRLIELSQTNSSDQISVGEGAISIVRTQSDAGTSLSVPRTELTKLCDTTFVSNLLGDVLPRFNPDTDVAITKNGLPQGTCNSTQIVRILKAALGKPDKNSPTKSLTITQERTIRFTVVQRRTSVIWITDKKSGEFLASLSTPKLASPATPNIPSISSDECALRKSDKYLGLSRGRIAMICALLPTPSPTIPDVTVPIDDKTLVFKVRVIRGDFIWCIDRRDASLLTHASILPTLSKLEDHVAVLPDHNPESELVVSGPSFKKFCEEKGQLLELWRRAATGLAQHESRCITFPTDGGSKSLTISYRSLGGKPALVITPRSIELVKSVEALHAVDPTAILPVELYGHKAIPCSHSSLRQLGIRNGAAFAERLAGFIGAPPRERFSNREITIEGGRVRFFSVRSGSYFLWAVDSRDQQLLTSGDLFKVIYPERHVTFSTKLMIALTRNGLKRLAPNTPSIAAHNIPLIKEALSNATHPVQLFTTSLGGASIDCFMRSDLQRFQEALRIWASSRNVLASPNQVQPGVTRMDVEAMCPALVRFLDAQSKTLNLWATKDISLPSCTLTLTLLKTSGRDKVGFSLINIDPTELRLQLSKLNPRADPFKADFGDYGVAVTAELLGQTHGKCHLLYDALLKRLGHPPSSPHAPLVVELQLESLGTVTFYLPHDTRYDAWYVAPKHTELLASPAFSAALGVQSTLPYREAEHLRIARDQLQKESVRNATLRALRLHELLGSADEYEGDLPVAIGPLQAFIVTLPGGQVCWAIWRLDTDLLYHPTVESILFEGAIPPFNPEIHVSTSEPELARFVHQARAAHNGITELVGRAKSEKGTLEERIRLKEEVFQLPYAIRGSRTVLCIRKEDLPRIAAALEWTMREDAQDQEFDKDSDLVSAISLLGSDERDIAAYLLLSRGKISADQLTFILKKVRAICRPSRTSQNLMMLPTSLPKLTVEVTEASNEGIPFIEINGECAGATEIQLAGDASHIFKVSHDGAFQGSIPIPGARNITLEFMALNQDRSERSDVVQVPLDLSHLADIIELPDTALLQLLERREDIMGQILGSDPASAFRKSLLTRQVTRKVLRHFSESEENGFSYLESRISATSGKLSKAILVAVQQEFLLVQAEDFGAQGSKSFFFQRWGAYKIREALRNGEKGIMLSFDPGLGKTRTALLAIGQNKFITVAPNGVVSFWAKEAKAVCPQSSIQVLSGPYAERDHTLHEDNNSTSLITNIEYVRQQPSGERIRSLSRDVCVIDEGHFLCNDRTAQSQAVSNITSPFKVLLTATPFAQYSGIGPLLRHLTDQISYSRAEISRVFSPHTPEDLVVLHHLLAPCTINLRKEDLFDTPPKGATERPAHTLPRKRFISPDEAGQFVLSMEQLRSQIELITDPHAWAQRHKNLVTYEDRLSRCYRNGYFEVHAAVDQITNDPNYIGINAPSPKHEAMRAIVERELTERDAKIVIMCRYRKQVEKYAHMFNEYGVCTIWGEMPQNNRGEKIENGRVCRFQTDHNGEFILDKRDCFIPDRHGRSILASDYELHAFQKSPDKRILIATYDCAAVGITATAGRAMVFDQIPSSHLILSQAMDRIHRLDATFKHPEVRYYFMVSRFPEVDLKSLMADVPKEKHDLVRRFLYNTQCQIDWQRIQTNGQIFSHIMYGTSFTSGW